MGNVQVATSGMYGSAGQVLGAKRYDSKWLLRLRGSGIDGPPGTPLSEDPAKSEFTVPL